ncbi:MAG TPA: DUF6675 family protein [Alphaproteobacteria bacterium]|jgi:hypothetical protein
MRAPRPREGRLSARWRRLLPLPFLLWPGAVAAQEAPRPPCGAQPVPAYPAASAKPNVAIWRDDGGTRSEWAFPGCSGWRPGEFKLVVALAGSFPHQGGADELLYRFGRISELRGIRYWSVSDKEWRQLIDDAAALNGPDVERRRKDFTIAEMKGGGALHFVQVETRLSSPVVYRMRVLEFRADRVVVETENVSVMRIALIPIMAPGETRTVHVLERLSPGIWGYYGLALSAQDPGLFLRVRDASLVNRAAAFYRYFVGIRTDREPPPAP